MNNPFKRVSKLAAQQEAIRARCFHSSGSFAEFSEETLDRSIPTRFEEMVCKYPDRVAIKSRRRSLSYLALNEESNRIARMILAHCGDQIEPVGIYLDHDCAIVAAILGILKTNKFYVPLDPNDPPARNQSMLQNSGLRTILANGSTLQALDGLATAENKVINIEEIDPRLPAHNLELSISSDTLAYIMYTSGSTGKPKAVMQTHRNLLQQTLLYTNTLHISAHDRLSLLHSCSNGACTPHLFGSLLNGAALYPFDVKVNGVAQLIDFLSRESLTIYHSIPALFRSLAHSVKGTDNFKSLRVLHVSGDTATHSDVELYKKHFPSDCVFVHRLGSREANTVFLYLIEKNYLAQGKTLPVGPPVEGKEILLVDDRGAPVEDGEVGEIVIKSRYLSPGYWGDPERTRAVFETDTDGIRRFHTGDVGRLRPDGGLEHLGRKDAQVKIRGYRIEIGEVEAAILNYGRIREVAVVVRENDAGDKDLAAYLVPAVEPKPTVGNLRQFMAATLPSYMIPAAFVFVKSLPFLPNGKIDRQALPDPGPSRAPVNTFVAPRTPIEEMLVAIWIDALGLDRVGVQDNFFDLGGHSLIATKILAAIQDQFQFRLEPRALFDNPTIEELALTITEAMACKSGLPIPCLLMPALLAQVQVALL